jgi:hypothetical protein
MERTNRVSGTSAGLLKLSFCMLHPPVVMTLEAAKVPCTYDAKKAAQNLQEDTEIQRDH